MPRRIDVSELSPAQREAARDAIVSMCSRIGVDRTEEVCIQVASGKCLALWGDDGLPAGSSFTADCTLRRNEYIEASALLIRLRNALGENDAEIVVRFLGIRRNVWGLLIAEALRTVRLSGSVLRVIRGGKEAAANRH